MRRTRSLATQLLLAGFFTIVLTGAAWAQESDRPAETTGPDQGLDVQEELSVETSHENAQKLLAQILADYEARLRYEERMLTASSEDSLVLRRQIITRRVRTMENLHTLADVLVALEEETPDPELRASVEEVFNATGPLWRPFVDDLRGQIDELRANRAGIAPEECSALEDRITRRIEFLDTVLDYWGIHLQKMELLGLDPSASRMDLEAVLTEHSDQVSGRIELALERIDEYSVLIGENPGDSGLPLLLIASKKDLDTNTASLELTLDLMDGLGLDTETYRTQLVTATRDIATGILDGGVAVSLLSQWALAAREWFVDSGPKLLIKVLIFLAIVFAFRLLARLVRKATKRALASSKFHLSELLTRMIINTVGNVVMVLGLMVALGQLGISLGPLMAGLGVVGFILGFALQDSLGNFAAGMMILLYRPYDVGDLVDISGVFGKVEKMSLVSTTILTLDHQTLVVPNSKIWGDVIKNVTAQNIRRVDMTFGISYSDDIPKSEQLLESILAEHDKILDDPEPMVRVHTLNESSVDFVVRPWVKTDDYWDVYWDVTRAVKMRMDEEGISIPFPQRDVHIYEEVLAAREGGTPVPVMQQRTEETSHTSHDSPSDDDGES